MSENELDGGGGSMALDSVYSERGTDEHSDEGPGSIRWSLKEHMRMEVSEQARSCWAIVRQGSRG